MAPRFLTIGHFLTTVTTEAVLWLGAVLVVAHLLGGADPRWGIAVGVLLGLGLLSKWTTAFLIGGLGAGLLVVPEGHILATPRVGVGAAVAVALWLPNPVFTPALIAAGAVASASASSSLLVLILASGVGLVPLGQPLLPRHTAELVRRLTLTWPRWSDGPSWPHRGASIHKPPKPA